MTALASQRSTTATPAHGSGSLVTPLVVAALAATGVGVAYRLFVRTPLGQVVDTAALRGGDVQHARVAEVLSRTLGATTLASLVLVCIVAAMIGLLRRRIDLAVAAGLLVIGANTSVQLLKTRLTRPVLDDFPAPNSFPSGHTAAAASVAFALIVVLPQVVRGTVALAGFGYVTLIAVATVWAEWHRPSDTIAAMFVVLAWGALAVFGVRAYRRRRATAAERRSRLSIVPLLAIGAVTTAAALLGLLALTVFDRVAPGLVVGRFAFLTGVAEMTAVAAATFVIWVRLCSNGRPDAGATDESPAPVEADHVPAEGVRLSRRGGPK